MDPKRSNACVHIYSWVQNPRHDFHSFWIKNSNAKFKSAAVDDKIQCALANRQKLPPDMK